MSAGLTVANHIPAVGATIEIAQVKGVEKVRKVVRLLNTLADWLPWIGLVLIAAAIALARRHRRTFIISMLGVAAGMILIGFGLLIGRHFYLNGTAERAANLNCWAGLRHRCPLPAGGNPDRPGRSGAQLPPWSPGSWAHRSTL